MASRGPNPVVNTTANAVPDVSPLRSPYANDEEASLDDAPAEEFRGATLQISQEGFASSRSPSTPGDTYSRVPGFAGSTDNSTGKNENEEKRTLVDNGTSTPKSTLFGRPSSRRSQSPMPPTNLVDAQGYFTFRDSLVQSAIDEAKASLVLENMHGTIKGAWLLTEIDHWDYEKERLVLLSEKSLFIVKYDFIALRQLEYRKIPLELFDKVIKGELTYPGASLMPRINGIAGGLITVVKDCLVRRVQDTVTAVTTVAKHRGSSKSRTTDDIPDVNTYERESILSYFAYETFEPRSRNVNGIRAQWNRDEPVSFRQRWNPFSKAIPWVTFTSHPLFWCKGNTTNGLFDVDTFGQCLLECIEALVETGDSNHICQMEQSPIVIDNYVGVPSLIHNTNNLGFFKVRGKVSF